MNIQTKLTGAKSRKKAAATSAAAAQRQRDTMLLLARVNVEGASAPIVVRIRNLSAGGVMAKPNPALADGTRVTIELRDLPPMAGTVAWATDAGFGIAFDAPIDPMTVRHAAPEDTVIPEWPLSGPPLFGDPE